MDKEPKIKDNTSGVYQENRTSIVIFVIACVVPIFGFVISFYGFNRSRRLNVNLKLGVLGIVFGFINLLLFTLLFYLWLINGGKF